MHTLYNRKTWIEGANVSTWNDK